MKLVDLNHQLQSIRSELQQAISQVLESGYFSEGSFVSTFETEFAQAVQSSHCVALNSGTSALHTILRSLDITSGDDVICPSNTCFATVEAICIAGATPVLVDCEAAYYNIDPDQIVKAITPQTKAIIAVHLYGQPAQMNKIKEIADRHQLQLIEDCAQAHLATFDGTMAGNFGIAGAFSFYPTKNLGAFGEGGAVVTNQVKLADRIRAFKNHGSYQKNLHEFIGHNYRMDSIQAAILSVKLKYLKEWTQVRKRNAELYFEFLSDLPEVTLPKIHPRASHVFHQFVIRTKDRELLKEHLTKSNIETAIHYPIPCHLQPALSYLGYKKGDFPVSEKLSNEILSLPVAEHQTSDNIKTISDSIRKFFRG